jgi:hypothetical protein
MDRQEGKKEEACGLLPIPDSIPDRYGVKSSSEQELRPESPPATAPDHFDYSLFARDLRH